MQVLTIIEENGYYPYGLKHESYNTVLNRYKAVVNETKVELKEAPGGGQVALNDNINDYKFNGQEWQNELGLDVTAMDFRQYSNDIGRFVCIDPVTHFSQTPYQFGNGNPMYWADPSGLDGITPEPINTWHYAGSGSSGGHGNLSNGDHMFGASGDSFWGGQAAFTGGDLAWKNYNAANGIQTFYGAEARAFLRGFSSIWHEGSVTYNGDGTTLDTVNLGFWEKVGFGSMVSETYLSSLSNFADANSTNLYKYGTSTMSAADYTVDNALRMAKISKFTSGLGNVVGGVGVVASYGSIIYKNNNNIAVSTGEYVGAGVGTTLFAAGLIAAGTVAAPAVAAVAIVYGIAQISSYLYSGHSIEENIFNL